jgi:hypothetical protein
MAHKDNVHRLLQECAGEVLQFIEEREPLHKDGWVPTVEVKDSLALNFVAVPRASKQYGEKGWVFAVLARMLEDDGRLEYKKEGSRSYCRSARFRTP